jgi:hypothetical protein
MLGKHSTSEVYPSPDLHLFNLAQDSCAVSGGCATRDEI